MRIRQPVIEGRFLRRYKRFFADVELADGSVVTAHCPNTGALLGCLCPGSRAVLRDSENPARKLRYTLQALQVGRALVNVDTSLPNRVVREAIEGGRVPELAGYERLRPEAACGASRVDFLLETDARTGTRAERCWIEVKSTTLAEERVALFPDAVTERGRRHLEELAHVARAGDRAVQLFFVSRGDVDAFRPADAIDPAYGRALRAARRAGVELLAFAARVRPDSLTLGRPLPIELPPARRAARTGARIGP